MPTPTADQRRGEHEVPASCLTTRRGSPSGMPRRHLPPRRLHPIPAPLDLPPIPAQHAPRLPHPTCCIAEVRRGSAFARTALTSPHVLKLPADLVPPP